MMRTTLLALAVPLLAVSLAACKAETTSSSTPAETVHEGDAHEGHDHGEAPHGGHVVILGDHAAHLEIAHGDGGELIVYGLDADMEPLGLDEAPVLNLLTDEGSVAVRGTAGADGGWVLEHDALMDHDVTGRFRLRLGGKTYSAEYSACDHGDEHDDCAHGPHDGTLASFAGADGKPGGTLELKLHDDKGDLELWLMSHEGKDLPFGLPLDTKVKVVFQDQGGRAVELAVRNATTNEDEDGVAMIRGGKTNYFVFPGATGADATWLVGPDFRAQVVVSFTSGGVTYTSEAFELEPHADHDHADHDGDEDHDDDHDDHE